MPRNVEIKARIEDIDALETRVAGIADSGPGEILQDDTFFHCDNGRLKLRTFAEDRGELIFYERPDESGPRECFYQISRTSEPSTLREALGLACGTAGRVRKRRILYRLGRTRIHLDRVEGLGHFLELEVVLEDDESSRDGAEEARTILRKLGIEDSRLVEGAYVDLLGTTDH
jgi:predicted adenylyl cyclase CyaB